MKRLLILTILLFSLVPAVNSVGQVASSYRAPAATVETRDETVYITRTGKKFHRGDCRYLSQSKIAIKRKAAIAQGYEACKVCRP